MRLFVAVFNEKKQKVEEKELKTYRVTGWEDAPSHKNLPRLAVIGGMQKPLDMALWSVGKYKEDWNYVLFCKDERVTVVQRGTTQGNYIAVRGNTTGVYVTFVHVNGHAVNPRGKIISQGEAICKIAPKSENGGFPAHIHIDMVKGNRVTRELLFNNPIIVTPTPPTAPEKPCSEVVKELQDRLDKKGKELSDYKLYADTKIDEKNTQVSGLEYQVQTLTTLLNENSQELFKLVEEKKELERVNLSLRKKRGVEVGDFTVKQITDYLTKIKVKDLRVRVLDFIDRVLPYLRKSS